MGLTLVLNTKIIETNSRDFKMSKVKMVKSVEEYNTAIAGSGLVCVDFFATWCPPCRMIAPILGGWAEKYEGNCLFYKVDVDELEEVSMEAQIECMPTFLFFKDGKILQLLKELIREKF